MEYINFLEHKDEDEDSELNELVDLITYKVKKFIKREDETQIATEITDFSHKHDLSLLMRLKITKNVMGVYKTFSLLFIAV